ncbi:MAG: hypothetical protein CEN89_82 [Candidatus Berkelbacteria bacterium Licking1014_7]|uniref:YbbR family protein n=1 Tax=Candidatus Berkelbacteria bacterium Licking1014_7 TaxID=2017147 RepID=A0A554LKN4_9BACT|nr:MAG: hypothetical protein CEN89_82 [Candidatus Berkelbacteria bacterium Licking1014_7]
MKPLENIYIKIICLVLAFGFWLFISFQLGRIGTFPADIAIDTINVKTNYLAVLSERSVKVKISAQPQVWQKISASNFHARVDLLGKSTGLYQLDVKVVSDNPEVQIIKISPDKVQVNIEEIQEKQQKVEIMFDGAPAQGFAVNGYQISPPTVVAKSSPTIFKKISRVVAKVNIDNEKNDFSRVYRLEPLDSQNNKIDNIVFSPEEVTISAQIGKTANVKTVGIKAEVIGDLKPGFQVENISVSPSVANITGDPSLVFETNFIPTQQISIAGESRTIEKNVALEFPTGLSSLDNLRQVKIVIKVVEAKAEKDIAVSNIEFLNLKNNLSVSGISPENVQIVVSAPASKISGFDGSQIKLQIDAADIGSAGEYNRQIKKENFILPENFEIVSIKTENIKFRVVVK